MENTVHSWRTCIFYCTHKVLGQVLEQTLWLRPWWLPHLEFHCRCPWAELLPGVRVHRHSSPPGMILVNNSISLITNRIVLIQQDLTLFIADLLVIWCYRIKGLYQALLNSYGNLSLSSLFTQDCVNSVQVFQFTAG